MDYDALIAENYIDQSIDPWEPIDLWKFIDREEDLRENLASLKAIEKAHLQEHRQAHLQAHLQALQALPPQFTSRAVSSEDIARDHRIPIDEDPYKRYLSTLQNRPEDPVWESWNPDNWLKATEQSAELRLYMEAFRSKLTYSHDTFRVKNTDYPLQLEQSEFHKYDNGRRLHIFFDNILLLASNRSRRGDLDNWEEIYNQCGFPWRNTSSVNKPRVHEHYLSSFLEKLQRLTSSPADDTYEYFGTPDYDYQDIVDTYIGNTIWYIYWNHRKSFRMFDNWEGAKEILLREVESVVETRSKEKWKKTKDIRDRFFVRWKFIQERLHIPAVPSRTKQPFGSIFSGSAEKAWKYALKAINEDIHQGRIPNAPRKSAAALLLAWSIDSRQREIDIYSDVVSPEFRAALDQWSSFSERDIKSFIQLCWNTETEDYGQLNEEDSAAALSELLESLRSSMGESGGSDDFRVSRAVLMHCMGEDDVVRCGDFISTRELRAIEVLHWNEESIGTGLNHHPSERLPNPHTRPPEVQEQQYAKDSLVDERIFGSICACVIVLIIVSFLQAIIIRGPLPLFILSMVPTDRQSFFAGTLKSYASTCTTISPGSLSLFAEGGNFKNLIDKIRDGDVQTIDQAQWDHLETVPGHVNLADYMRFFNDCKEHLEKLGLSPCEAPIFEDESTPTEDLLDMAAQLSSDKDILSRDYDLPPDHNLLSQPMGFEDAIEMDLNPNPAIYFQPTNSGSNGVSSSCSSSLGHPFYPHPDQPSNQYTDLLYGEEADMMETTALHIPQTSTVCPSLLMDLSPQTPSSQTFRGRSPTFASIPSSATSSQAANPTTNSSAPRPSQDPLIYTCRKNCGKGFKGISRRSNRTRHENSVHGEENVCKRCGVRLKVGRADYRKSHDRACKGR